MVCFMNREEIKGYVEDILSQKYDNQYVMTDRIIYSLSDAVQRMIDGGRLPDTKEGVLKAMNMDYTQTYIKEHQPNIAPVGTETINRIVSYFAEKLPTFDVTDVMRKSNHPDDNYLYAVVGSRKDNNGHDLFSCWTSWNDSTESLNHGHYDVGSFDSAMHIIKDNFNDISDDLERFGPNATIVHLDPDSLKKKENINDNQQTQDVQKQMVRHGRSR